MLSVVSSPVVVRAPAKVNLHLGVGDLREDGYHDLTTVFQALSLSDDVQIAPSAALRVKVTGEGAEEVPTDRGNLVWQAAVKLADLGGRAPLVEFAISKGIPVAGGMAGGSADAAAALVGLNDLWELGLGRTELSEIAAELGSDVPFSLHGGTALGRGRGEKLLPVLSRNTFHWVLALAKDGLSTPAVFRELDRLREVGDPPRLDSPEELLQALASGEAKQLAPLLGNDLQAAALSLKPDLRRTLRAGCHLRSPRGHRLRLRPDLRVSVRERGGHGHRRRRARGRGGVPQRADRVRPGAGRAAHYWRQLISQPRG